MKNLDFAAMENVQGGTSGTITLNLPITTLLGSLPDGLGNLLGIGLQIGLGLSYNTDTVPAISLPFGL